MRLALPLAVVTAAAVLVAVPAPAQELEHDRQAQLCAGMRTDVHLPNGTEADCVSDTYAIEVDFSRHWAEAIGQSLLYASELDLLPGIVLVCHRNDDPALCYRHALRIEQTVSYWHIGMTLWLCGPDNVRLSTCRRVDLMQD